MKAQIVSFHCVLKDKVGKVLSSTFNQDVITGSLDPEAPLPELARAMADLKKGEKRRVFLTAPQAYGYYDPRLTLELLRSEIDPQNTLRMGMEVQLPTSKHDSLRSWRVTGFTGFTVLLDGNHPLAGQDLEFEIEATEARDATWEELHTSMTGTVH